MAMGSYSFNNFFNVVKDKRFLEEWACSVSSSNADSLRDKSRLYEWIYWSLGVAGRSRPDRRGGNERPVRARLKGRTVEIVAWIDGLFWVTLL